MPELSMMYVNNTDVISGIQQRLKLFKQLYVPEITLYSPVIQPTINVDNLTNKLWFKNSGTGNSLAWSTGTTLWTIPAGEVWHIVAFSIYHEAGAGTNINHFGLKNTEVDSTPDYTWLCSVTTAAAATTTAYQGVQLTTPLRVGYGWVIMGFGGLAGTTGQYSVTYYRELNQQAQ